MSRKSPPASGGLTVFALVALLPLAGCLAAADAGDGPFAGETVEVAAIWTGAEQAGFRRVLDGFEARTGAEVRYTSGGDDLPTLLNSRLSGGAPPDVALVGQPGVVAQFARRGVLTPLTDPARTAVRRNYQQFWIDLGTVDGALYGAYYKVAHKSVIWYRTDAFREAGVMPPTDWRQFQTVTRTLADAGVGTMAVPGADGWVLTDWFENVYLRQAGPQRYDQLARREIGWDHPSVVEALRLLARYWTLDRAVQPRPQQLPYSQAVADVFGTRPESAMLAEGDFVAVEIDRLGQVSLNAGADFFPWPAINGSPTSVVTAGDQAVAFTDRSVTMALIAYLASPEAARTAVARGGFLSANERLELTAYPDPVTRRLARSLQTAQVLRFDLSDLTPQAFGGSTDASLWQVLQDFVAAPADPVGVAAALERAAQRHIGDRS